MGFFSNLLDMVAPPKCAFCRITLKRGEKDICSSCRDKLKPLGKAGEMHGDYYSVCFCAYEYKDGMRDAFLRFKFNGDMSHTSFFGKLIADCIEENLKGRYDMISWVPISPERLKKRGFDQSMLLAMAAALELSDVAVETLRKDADIPAQSGIKDGRLRRENVSGAYSVPDPELIRGRRILLIDDIVTTGATISECAATLLMAGAESVVCASLAKAK